MSEQSHGRNLARNPIKILISEVKQIRHILTRILFELEQRRSDEQPSDNSFGDDAREEGNQK